MNLECRYKSQLTLGAASLSVEETPSKKMLIFDLKVVSTIEPTEELKDPQSRVFQQQAAEVVNQLFLNWSSKRVPSKIEVLEFLFINTDDLIRTVNQDIDVILQLTYQNDVGVEEPAKEQVSDHVEEILETIKILKEQDSTFVSQSDVNAVEDIAFTLLPIMSYANLVGYGQMDPQFSLSFYNTAELDQKTFKIRMGQVLFVSAKWANPVTDIGFYIDSCKYSCGNNFIDIIKVYNLHQ